MINLYPYQQKIIDDSRAIYKSGCKSILISSPTGSGKSITAAAFVKSAISKRKRVWYVVPRKILAQQISDTFESFDIEHSFIASGAVTHWYKPAQVCSLMTLANRIQGQIQWPDLCVIDETHFGGTSLDNLVAELKRRNCAILGLSATPWRLDGKGLGCYYDDMVEGPDIAWLIQNGFLSDYKLFSPDQIDLSKIKITAGDYAKGELDNFMQANKYLVGNAANHYLKHVNGKLAIAYCVSRAHSKMTAQIFRDAGVNAEHLDGESENEYRSEVVSSFAKREVKILCNAELLTFGFDLAQASGIDVTVEAMFDLQPTKSLSKQMQKWGRVLRKKSDKAVIFDHSNNWQEHGYPDTSRAWSLEDRDKKAVTSAEKSIAVKHCNKCFYCHRPAPACPNCGHVYEVQSREIEEVDGELKEIDRSEIIAERKKAKSFEDLVSLGVIRGYRNPAYWARKVLDGRVRNRG